MDGFERTALKESSRKYFLVFNPQIGDFEKIYFRENEEDAAGRSSMTDSSLSDSDSDRPSKRINIIKKPGCVTIELISGRRNK